MKKLLIVLCALLLFTAVCFCLPRTDIPVSATITLLYPDETLDQVYFTLDAEDAQALHALLAGRLLLPDWTGTFIGQRFYYSSANACHGILFEWDGDSMLFVLPKQGSRHLLQALGGDSSKLIWLGSADLDTLQAIYEDAGVLYPPVITE